MKRSYVRRFVHVLQALGDDLKFPKAVPRNLGVDVARALTSDEQIATLRAELRGCISDAAQSAVLHNFLKATRVGEASPAKATRKEKRAFHTGSMKVIARNGECRIVTGLDFTDVPKETLEAAVAAFEKVLRG